MLVRVGVIEPWNLSYVTRFHKKKVAVLLDFVQIRGGEGPAQFFCHLFISAFLVNKRIVFPKECQ